VPGRIELVRGDEFDVSATPDVALIATMLPQIRPRTGVFALFLLGQRSIRWVQRRGLDSMRGEQDVPLGADLEITIGGSIPVRDGEDAFIGGGRFYAAAENGRLLLAGRGMLDLRYRRSPRPATWEDLLLDTEAVGYWRVSGAHTLVARSIMGGGWGTRSPHQVTLGGPAGLRGYSELRFPGGQRAILTLEDRMTFDWPAPALLDLGATAFLDLGRTWTGDAPFGLDSGWRASAGLGLRGSFPAGGRTTYRVDLALPLESGTRLRDVRLGIVVGEIVGLGSTIQKSRRREQPRRRTAADAFSFPD